MLLKYILDMPFKPARCAASWLSISWFAAQALFALTVQSVSAEEGGSGHYIPGSVASFADGVPSEEQLVLRLDALNYDGQFSPTIAVPIGGLSALNVDVQATSLAFTGVWRPPIEIGEQWSYALGFTVPYVDLEVSADLKVPVGTMERTIRREDSASGLGDIILMPVKLNYRRSESWNYNFRVNLYAPTGDYKAGRLANEGKNYWSVQPLLGALYLSPESGRELSMYAGLVFNQENDDTNYESGTQAHLEFTASQHFPIWGGVAGVGATGYWYEQISGDSGEGARFGSFKGTTTGLGPTLSYVGSGAVGEVILELKWVHEFDVERRPEGDLVLLKALLVL